MTHEDQFTQDLADEICVRIAEGETLVGICTDVHMPRPVVVRSWVLKDINAFRGQYNGARKMWADSLADEMKELLDQDPEDMGVMQKFGNNVVALMREKIRGYQWLCSKANPAMYGDKLDTHHTGEVTKRVHIVDSFDGVKFKDVSGRITNAN